MMLKESSSASTAMWFFLFCLFYNAKLIFTLDWISPYPLLWLFVCYFCVLKDIYWLLSNIEKGLMSNQVERRSKASYSGTLNWWLWNHFQSNTFGCWFAYFYDVSSPMIIFECWNIKNENGLLCHCPKSNGPFPSYATVGENSLKKVVPFLLQVCGAFFMSSIDRFSPSNANDIRMTVTF